MTKRIDHTGQTFSLLTVIRRGEDSKHGIQWICQCACGNETLVLAGNLRTGNTTSCGCHRDKRRSESHTTHGLVTVPEYSVWRNVISRCTLPCTDRYAAYGGRGISVCDRWKDDFAAFYADMGPRPSPEHSIDRINTDGNYAPENCRWATRVEQMNNMRRNHMITAFGKTQSMMMWSREQGITYSALKTRINKLGWSVEKALTTPVRKR